MRENDARRLSHETLEALRERAVRQVQEGESPETVARVLGLNRSTVYGWLAQYRRGGWGALKAKLSRDNQDDEPATIRMTVRRRRGDEGWA
jgi:transposase